MRLPIHRVRHQLILFDRCTVVSVGVSCKRGRKIENTHTIAAAVIKRANKKKMSSKSGKNIDPVNAVINVCNRQHTRKRWHEALNSLHRRGKKSIVMTLF